MYIKKIQKNIFPIIISSFLASCSTNITDSSKDIFSFTKANSKIIFESKKAEGLINIFSLDLKTGKRISLTDSLKAENFAFDISKNKDKIVFVSKIDSESNIYTMNIDGTDIKKITNDKSLNLFPKISPDGKLIAYISNIDGNDEIYTINIDGTNKKRLTNNIFKENNISWFPDSKKIAFYSDRDTNNEIYTMNIDGTEETNISKNQSNDYYPVVSPTGKEIAFISNRNNKWNIYISDSNGQNIKKISDGKTDLLPTWSKDGTKISYLSRAEINENSITNNIIIKDLKNNKDIVVSKNQEVNFPSILNLDDSILFTLFKDGKNLISIEDINSKKQITFDSLDNEDFYPILVF